MQPTFRAVLRPAALALTLLLSAAGAAQASSSAIDACKLLSAAEVSAALGQTAEPARFIDNGVTSDGARSTTCLWAVPLAPGTAADPTKSLGGRSFAILNVMNWPGGPDDAGKFLESFRSAFTHGAISSRPVEVQVGADEALWWGDGVAARRGAVSFGISVASSGDRAARRPKAEALARLVARRLPRRPG